MSEKEDDRKFADQHGAGGIGSDGIGWFDSVLEFDDYHAEANEVTAPFVEQTGFSFEDLPTGLPKSWPQTWNLNFFPQNSGAMLSSLRGSGAPQPSNSAQMSKSVSGMAERRRAVTAQPWFKEGNEGSPASPHPKSKLMSGLAQSQQRPAGSEATAPPAAEAEDDGVVLGVETSWDNWRVAVQGSSADAGRGLVVAIDHTDWDIPNTLAQAHKCQGDARVQWSTAANDGPMEGAERIFEGKLQCDNWAVKMMMDRPEEPENGEAPTFMKQPAGYLKRSFLEGDLNINMNTDGFWKDYLKSTYTGGLLFDGGLKSGFLGFRAWGLNWTRTDKSGGDWFSNSGLEKATAAVTYERAWDSDFTDSAELGLRRFYDKDNGAYTLTASGELPDGKMCGVSLSADEQAIGVRIPLPGPCSMWNTAQLRTRFVRPSDPDEPKVMGFAFFWTCAKFAAEACLQLRHDPATGTRPRLWFKVQKPEEEEE